MWITSLLDKGSYEDLGGPTPENYKPDDDSVAQKPKVKTVSDVVNKGPSPEPMKGVAKEEAEVEEEEIVESRVDESEVVDEELETGYDIEEDVNALLGGEELSEEFREKAKLIFESRALEL